MSNNYTSELKLIKNIYKDNIIYYRKVYLDGVSVYKDILYKDYYLQIVKVYYLTLLVTNNYKLIVVYQGRDYIIELLSYYYYWLRIRYTVDRYIENYYNYTQIKPSR